MRGEWVIGVRGSCSRGEQWSKKENPKSSRPVRSRCSCSRRRSSTRPRPPRSRWPTTSRPARRSASSYRYVDLRRPPLQRTLIQRHDINRATRNYLSSQGCLELETPFLVKYTPGGARNFLVPARMARGSSTRSRRARSSTSSSHGVRLRPVLPDREVLPRRGLSRRSPARVHADRHRAVVHQPVGDLPPDRGADLRDLEAGARRRPQGALPQRAVSRRCRTPRR
jgi:hypothetical protein